MTDTYVVRMDNFLFTVRIAADGQTVGGNVRRGVWGRKNHWHARHQRSIRKLYKINGGRPSYINSISTRSVTFKTSNMCPNRDPAYLPCERHFTPSHRYSSIKTRYCDVAPQTCRILHWSVCIEIVMCQTKRFCMNIIPWPRIDVECAFVQTLTSKLLLNLRTYKNTSH
jgi:hypothetical protein